MNPEFGQQHSGYSPANENAAAAPETYGGSASEHTMSRHEFIPPDERRKGRGGRRSFSGKNATLAATCAAILTLTLSITPLMSGTQAPITPSTPSGPASPTPHITTAPQPTPMSTPTATVAPVPTTPTPAETTADISVRDNRMYFIRSASFLVGSVFFEKPESISFALISIWAPKENFCLFDQFLEQSELAGGRYDLPEQTADDIFDKIDAGKFGDSFDLMKADLEMRAEIQYINGDSKTLTCKAESQMWYGI
ncbi:MAG: hypothetical protein GX900_08380, partial [Clostridiaceae bacterium]|nr:hypothetical protein [Clostridiaceae bacterium]